MYIPQTLATRFSSVIDLTAWLFLVMDATKDDELAGPSSPAQEKVAQISELGDKHEQDRLEGSRYKPQLRRNRSVFTLLFQTLAIAAIPFGEGGPLLDAIYGGGPLSIFVGWIVVCLLCECKIGRAHV